MKVEQFVMAYQIEQDRIRAMLPEGYESLRPVLRINTELRDEGTPDERAYVEFNTPVAAQGKRGWLNIANWEGSKDGLSFERSGGEVTISAPFFTLRYSGIGVEGGCPAQDDNDGCFFIGDTTTFRPTEEISSNKEFCDCEFAWHFNDGDAHGVSIRKTLPAFWEQPQTEYEKSPLTAEAAAAIECKLVLGTYIVRFER